ncbi:MAG: hypothetical protein HQK49_11335 [Oligoflexia bacterium]|nr:hypothetical protein [Oligoflexia bacterium]
MNTKTISIFDYCGPFCTQRDTAGIDKLFEILSITLEKKEKIILSRNNVKMMTVSFIDQLMVPLAITYSKDQIEKLIIFNPPLEEIFLKQIERGIRLRTIHS